MDKQGASKLRVPSARRLGLIGMFPLSTVYEWTWSSLEVRLYEWGLYTSVPKIMREGRTTYPVQIILPWFSNIDDTLNRFSVAVIISLLHLIPPFAPCERYLWNEYHLNRMLILSFVRNGNIQDSENENHMGTKRKWYVHTMLIVEQRKHILIRITWLRGRKF